MNIALFDFDGTITSKETFVDFIQFAAAPNRLRLGKLLLSPLIAAYKLGFVPARTIRAAIAAFAFRGRQAAELRLLGAEFATRAIPPLVRSSALERIRWHKAQGDVVVVVSASLDVYLSVWCQSHALDLICTQLAEQNGVITGNYRGGDCSGNEKRARVLAQYDLAKYPCVYAYGDTAEDHAMLSLAHKQYFQGRPVADTHAR